MDTVYIRFEIFELFRKLTMTSLIVYINPDSPMQNVIGVLISVVSMIIYARLSPYNDNSHDVLQILCQISIFSIYLIGLLLRMDSTMTPAQTDNWGWVLVLAAATPLGYCLIDTLLDYSRQLIAPWLTSRTEQAKTARIRELEETLEKYKHDDGTAESNARGKQFNRRFTIPNAQIRILSQEVQSAQKPTDATDIVTNPLTMGAKQEKETDTADKKKKKKQKKQKKGDIENDASPVELGDEEKAEDEDETGASDSPSHAARTQNLDMYRSSTARKQSLLSTHAAIERKIGGLYQNYEPGYWW